MDSIDRFVKLMGSSGGEAAPMLDVPMLDVPGLDVPGLDVSAAVLQTIRGQTVRVEKVDYVPLALSAALAVAASVFVLLSLPGALVVDRSVAELVNPISMMVP